MENLLKWGGVVNSTYKWQSKKNDGEDFHRGTFQAGFLSKIPSCVFTGDFHSLGDQIAMSYSTTNGRSFPNVRNILGFGKTENDVSFVAYQDFTDTFDKWAVKEINQGNFFDKKWCINQLNRCLKTMHLMDTECVSFVGEPTLVIWNENINFINIGEGRMTDKNKQDFRNFVTNNIRCFDSNDSDWRWFLESFDHGTVNQIAKSPILLTELETYVYAREISFYMRNMSEEDKEKLLSLISTHGYDYFYGWNLKIEQGSMLGRIYLEKWPDRKLKKNASELLEFIERVFDCQSDDHYEITYGNHGFAGEGIYSREHEVALISNLFPGYFSFVHNVLLHHFKDAKITRKYFEF